MQKSLTLFDTAAAMAQHAGMRQALIARNIANADTPGFRAMQMGTFAETYGTAAAQPMKATRSGHIAQGLEAATSARPTSTSTEPAPNGNSVSLEDELLASVAVGREHSRALAIYRHGLNVLRATIGR